MRPEQEAEDFWNFERLPHTSICDEKDSTQKQIGQKKA